MNFKVFVEPTIYEPTTILMRDGIIKTTKFLFVWMVIASVYLIKLRWQKSPGFCGTNHVSYELITTWIHGEIPRYVNLYYFYCKRVWWKAQKIIFLQDIYFLIHTNLLIGKIFFNISIASSFPRPSIWFVEELSFKVEIIEYNQT